VPPFLSQGLRPPPLGSSGFWGDLAAEGSRTDGLRVISIFEAPALQTTVLGSVVPPPLWLRFLWGLEDHLWPSRQDVQALGLLSASAVPRLPARSWKPRSACHIRLGCAAPTFPPQPPTLHLQGLICQCYCPLKGTPAALAHEEQVGVWQGTGSLRRPTGHQRELEKALWNFRKGGDLGAASGKSINKFNRYLLNTTTCGHRTWH
jgi:hypothetical protein